MAANGARRTLHFPSSSAKTLFIRSLVTSSTSKAANFAGISFSKPSFASSRFSPRRLTFSRNKLYGGYLRVPVELVGGLSVMPLHSITASALLTSLLSLSNQNWGCLSEDASFHVLVPKLNSRIIKQAVGIVGCIVMSTMCSCILCLCNFEKLNHKRRFG